MTKIKQMEHFQTHIHTFCLLMPVGDFHHHTLYNVWFKSLKKSFWGPSLGRDEPWGIKKQLWCDQGLDWKTINTYRTHPHQLLNEAFKSLVGMSPQIKTTNHSLHDLLVCERQTQMICLNEQFPHILLEKGLLSASASMVDHVTGQSPQQRGREAGPEQAKTPQLWLTLYVHNYII